VFDEEIHSAEFSGGASPESQVLAGADKETLRRALEELPDVFREVFVLREIEGMSYKEIADVASISLGTVMSRLARARTRLRQSLGAVLGKSPEMSCELTQRFVPGYLDGELDLLRTIEMETHLKGCAACARELENQQALREVLRRGSVAYAAPAALRMRIQSSLGASTPTKDPERASAWYALRTWRWAAAFAVLVICTVTAWQLVPGLHGPSNDQRLEAEVFASHLRSLEAII